MRPSDHPRGAPGLLTKQEHPKWPGPATGFKWSGRTGADGVDDSSGHRGVSCRFAAGLLGCAVGYLSASGSGSPRRMRSHPGQVLREAVATSGGASRASKTGSVL